MCLNTFAVTVSAVQYFYFYSTVHNFDSAKEMSCILGQYRALPLDVAVSCVLCGFS